MTTVADKTTEDGTSIEFLRTHAWTELTFLASALQSTTPPSIDSALPFFLVVELTTQLENLTTEVETSTPEVEASTPEASEGNYGCRPRRHVCITSP